MFPQETYVQRRDRLRQRVLSGLILLLGNDESPMNYSDNMYPFRQDSTFLYYFGLDQPGLAGLIDVDEGTECVFGEEPTEEDIVWTGPQPPLRNRCARVGVTRTAASEALRDVVDKALPQHREIHILPQYRAENVLRISDLLHVTPDAASGRVSEPLVRAVIAQRSVKSAEEIEQIEAALAVSCEMHTTAMRMARPGVAEQEIAGAMEGIAVAQGVRLAFPTIFSIHGEILHNPLCGNILKVGDIVVNDSGAESALRYASDVSRTIPVAGRFSQQQKEIYSIVLQAQAKAIAATKPGIEWREVHRLASVTLMEGLKALGLTRGDPAEAVAAGAHTLFFPCGVGHMIGLDVHDMDALGEEYVGYTDAVRRNPEFGWRSLRLAKAVEAGFVITVEPGIYFMPHLIDRWKTERKCEPFIDYNRLDTWRHFGGLRVEDDILVTEAGCRILGPPIPKTIDEVEALASA